MSKCTNGDDLRASGLIWLAQPQQVSTSFFWSWQLLLLVRASRCGLKHAPSPFHPRPQDALASHPRSSDALLCALENAESRCLC
eukprot:scaffold300313_cov26-Tisochrysis_lutea.AAC.1